MSRHPDTDGTAALGCAADAMSPEYHCVASAVIEPSELPMLPGEQPRKGFLGLNYRVQFPDYLITDKPLRIYVYMEREPTP